MTLFQWLALRINGDGFPWLPLRINSDAVEYLRSFVLFGLWQLWQSSGPGGRVHFMIAEKSSDVKVKRVPRSTTFNPSGQAYASEARICKRYPRT